MATGFVEKLGTLAIILCAVQYSFALDEGCRSLPTQQKDLSVEEKNKIKTYLNYLGVPVSFDEQVALFERARYKMQLFTNGKPTKVVEEEHYARRCLYSLSNLKITEKGEIELLGNREKLSVVPYRPQAGSDVATFERLGFHTHSGYNVMIGQYIDGKEIPYIGIQNVKFNQENFRFEYAVGEKLKTIQPVQGDEQFRVRKEKLAKDMEQKRNNRFTKSGVLPDSTSSGDVSISTASEGVTLDTESGRSAFSQEPKIAGQTSAKTDIKNLRKVLERLGKLVRSDQVILMERGDSKTKPGSWDRPKIYNLSELTLDDSGIFRNKNSKEPLALQRCEMEVNNKISFDAGKTFSALSKGEREQILCLQGVATTGAAIKDPTKKMEMISLDDLNFSTKEGLIRTDRDNFFRKIFLRKDGRILNFRAQEEKQDTEKASWEEMKPSGTTPIDSAI